MPANISGVLPSITEALNKYDLFHFLVSWFSDLLNLEVDLENKSEKL